MDEMTTEQFLQRQYDKIEQRRNREVREILSSSQAPALNNESTDRYEDETSPRKHTGVCQICQKPLEQEVEKYHPHCHAAALQQASELVEEQAQKPAV